MYCIYIHKNKINGKVYIGQTKHYQNPNLRWRDGYGYRNNETFYRDIVKYGWDSGFNHDILEICKNIDEANKKEIEYILKYQATNPNYGYNISSGGGNSLSVNNFIDLIIDDNPYQIIGFNTPDGLLRTKKNPIEVEKARYEKKMSKKKKQ